MGINCREKCRWAAGCDSPGSKMYNPDMCPRAWQLEDYWHDAETMREHMRDLETRHKFEEEDISE